MTNNIINNTLTSGGDHALLVEGRKDAIVCARIVGNTVTNADATRSDIRLRERDSTVVTLEQGASLLSDTPLAVLNANNTSTPNSVTGSPAVVANGTCDTPPSVFLSPSGEPSESFVFRVYRQGQTTSAANTFNFNVVPVAQVTAAPAITNESGAPAFCGPALLRP